MDKITNGKYLAMLTTGDIAPIDIYSRIYSTHFYISKENVGTAFVSPYVMIIDGNDIIVFENKDKELEIGLRCLVNKPEYKTNSQEEFKAMMTGAVIGSLNIAFKNIYTREGTEIQNEPNQPTGKEIELPIKLINIYSTFRAIYSIDKKYVIPVYFIIVPNNRLVKFIPLPDMPSFRTIRLDSLTKSGLAEYHLSSIAKSILTLIGVKEITFPITPPEE